MTSFFLIHSPHTHTYTLIHMSWESSNCLLLWTSQKVTQPYIRIWGGPGVWLTTLKFPVGYTCLLRWFFLIYLKMLPCLRSIRFLNRNLTCFHKARLFIEEFLTSSSREYFFSLYTSKLLVKCSCWQLSWCVFANNSSIVDQTFLQAFHII